MRVTSSAILLCAVKVVSGVAFEPRQAASCTPGIKLANYNDLPAIAIDDGNTGLTNFNPYLDLNYTRFSVIAAQPDNKLLFYSLSQISSGPLAVVQAALVALLGPLGGILPPILAPPSIIGATPRTTFRINSFQFGCSIRAGGAATVIPFSCRVTVRPVEPSRAGESATCTYTANPTSPPVFQTCNVNLAAGVGYKFQTVATVSIPEFAQLSSLINAAAENFLVTGLDNLSYTEFCAP
ncbi:uncharacterized protein JN550_007340 [Neoarthrinium moseri]|uniref:uncharacterized protein n=1 Tax=Neoarthrinium moseri TaxID=1658444 RepID=UPI001FDD69D3|nr:uncharacterized protein JN550_007340 [Neoarthrinium moseri]KAI1866793.1 hypothetical protein JN550_007340 [Neoarthrinium moseri]